LAEVQKFFLRRTTSLLSKELTMSTFKRFTKVTCFALTGLLVAMSCQAQAESRACPQPVTMMLTAQSSSSTLHSADFPSGLNVSSSSLNHTQLNKHYGYTFEFKPPATGCCQFNEGILTVSYKTLSKGTSNKTSDAGNDTGGPVRNGTSAAGAGYIWPNSGVASGATTTKTYTIPAEWIASGRVSFYSQDDTAVTSATLRVSGCCVTNTRPAP
jgi:hypothetical protein